jgi:hypothetical protein
MRFASREKAILSQWEVGAGLVPGGGPMARLPRLIGRGRALEVLLGADDISGELAERYGYVNRVLPDAELDDFVDGLAMRISSFDKSAIAETKRLVDIASLPPDAEIAPEWGAFLAFLGRPASQTRLKGVDGAWPPQTWRCRTAAWISRGPAWRLSRPTKKEMLAAATIANAVYRATGKRVRDYRSRAINCTTKAPRERRSL